MKLQNAPTAVRLAAVNAFLGTLVFIALFVRHWIVIALWFALLVGFLIGAVVGRPASWALGFLFFMGWLVSVAAFLIMTGQAMWTGFLAVGIVIANWLAYDWNQSPPPPADPKAPAFADRGFSMAFVGLLVSGVLVSLILANVIPAAWLGPACGMSGSMGAVLVIMMARWQIQGRGSQP